MEPVVTGNVYIHPNYYRIVTKVSPQGVEYKFFNRIQYSYIPCGNRKKIKDCCPTPVIVSCTMKFFLFDIKDRKMILCDMFFGREPYFAPPRPLEDF